jgi:hypothetical protein
MRDFLGTFFGQRHEEELDRAKRRNDQAIGRKVGGDLLFLKTHLHTKTCSLGQLCGNTSGHSSV